MIVLDASAAVQALSTEGEARRHMQESSLVAPPHVDLEIASTLRSRIRRDEIDEALAHAHLAAWTAAGVRRFPLTHLLPRIWELRDNLTPYDAGYVALAEAIGCDLVTADSRMARAPGPRCSITVIKT